MESQWFPVPPVFQIRRTGVQVVYMKPRPNKPIELCDGTVDCELGLSTTWLDYLIRYLATSGFTPDALYFSQV